MTDIYAHFKGELYRKILFATHTETGEKMVVYQGIKDGRIWCRPADKFFEELDKDEYPNATQAHRFEPFEEE